MNFETLIFNIHCSNCFASLSVAECRIQLILAMRRKELQIFQLFIKLENVANRKSNTQNKGDS